MKDFFKFASKVVFLVLLTFTTVAHADGITKKFEAQCDVRKNIFDYLETEYKETLYWAGSITPDRKQIAMITMNQDTSTWTFLLVDDKIACILADGKGSLYQNIPGTSI